jgi:hypothetical protein
MKGIPAGGPEGERRPSWRWALVVVASVHLLTTAGMWWITDHGEMLYASNRLLTKGTMDLWQPGERWSHFLRWTQPKDGKPLRSRFGPIPSLTLLPLLALDKAIGWGEPDQFGRLVHLHGHLFVLLGLFLVGRSVLWLGASEQAAAAAVLLTGLSWPAWMVARRLGPEPIHFFLIAVFVAAETRPSGPARIAQALSCALLPWTHVTGVVWCTGLVLATLLGAEGPFLSRVRRAVPALGGSLLGLATFFFFWNHLYHGDWYSGGYTQLLTASYTRLNPLDWLRYYSLCFALELPLLVGLGLYGLWRTRREAVPGRALAFTLTSVALAYTLVAPFTGAPFLWYSDPSRRLAFLLPCWGVVLGATWDHLGLRRNVAVCVLGLALPLGLYSLVQEGGLYITSYGIFYYPEILWLVLLGEKRFLVAFLGIALLLCVAVVSALKTLRLFPEPARG